MFKNILINKESFYKGCTRHGWLSCLVIIRIYSPTSIVLQD